MPPGPPGLATGPGDAAADSVYAANSAFAGLSRPGRYGNAAERLRATARDRGLLAAAAIALLAAFIYAAYGIRIHRALHSNAFDLAFFDQIIWNTAHGRWFETTYTAYNFLGQHFEPLLMLLAAAYRFGAGPETLIAIQAAGASLAAIPLYIAARRLAGTIAALPIASAYLLSPFLQRGLNFDFHPDLLIPLFAFGALAAWLAGRRTLFIGSIVALLLVKEDAFLVAAALGWVCVLRRDRRLGATVIAGALLYGAVVIGLVMPHLRNGHSSDLVERYGYLGANAPAIAAAVFRHPDRVLSHLASSRVELAVLGLLASTAFLPLLAPEVLIAAVPVALIGLLSTHPQQESLDLQYGAPVLAAIYIAALFGIERAGRIVARWRAVSPRPPAGWGTLAAALALLVASAAGAALYGRFPPELGGRTRRFNDDGGAAALQRVSRLIPADASLSAQTGLAPHLSQREVQWEFPRLKGAEYVIVEDGGNRSSQSNDGYEETRARLPALGYIELAHDGTIHLYRRVPAAGP